MKFIVLTLGIFLAGCGPQVFVVQQHLAERAEVPDFKAMENCEKHLRSEQKYNSLSPRCYCIWQEDSKFNARRGTFPKRYLNETAVQCDTCDPFQRGYRCGDEEEDCHKDGTYLHIPCK